MRINFLRMKERTTIFYFIIPRGFLVIWHVKAHIRNTLYLIIETIFEKKQLGVRNLTQL